jgi:hypothetical protein
MMQDFDKNLAKSLAFIFTVFAVMVIIFMTVAAFLEGMAKVIVLTIGGGAVLVVIVWIRKQLKN